MRFAARRSLPVAPLAVLIATAALTWGCSNKDIGTYPGKNILVISVDTLRADHLGAYGYSRVTSPAIDALSKRAITFEGAFAPRGSTWPSLATMLTSLSPATHNVRENGQYMAADTPTIAGMLVKAGYEAEAFVSGSICHLTQRIAAFGKTTCGDDAFVASKASDFLRSRKGQPFFAWLHLIAPHGPYDPPPAHDVFTKADYNGPVGRDQATLGELIRSQRPLTDADRAQLYGLYDGEIRFADAQIALVLQALEEQGLRGNTIIAFLADHGEELGDHNGYLYHACSVYDSVLRIPMMIALPDAAAAGMRFSQIVQTADLAPTLLAMVGVESLPTFEGRSLLPGLNGRDHASAQDPDFEPSVASEWYDATQRNTVQTLRTPRWRYVSNPYGITPRCPPKGDYFKVAREELYDHAADPLDLHNVAAGHPDLTRRFAKIVEAPHAASAKAMMQPLDKNLEEELRSFGYVE